MLPIIIYTRKLLFRQYTGFSFFIFIWISRLEKDAARLIRHEKIHFWQQVELLFVFHWLLYGMFYIVSRCYGHHHYIAYRYNPFEMEAYDHDNNIVYLASRKPYAWLSRLNKYGKLLREDHSKSIPKGKKISW
jgi:hypothetical protein